MLFFVLFLTMLFLAHLLSIKAFVRRCSRRLED